MAQALGADLAHMDATEVAFLIDPQQTVRGILVNGRGQRYVPEDMYSGPDRAAHAVPPGRHRVPDHRRRRAGRGHGRDLRRRRSSNVRRRGSARSVAELEAEIGLPTGTLQATVSVYNDNAARGEDPLLHKKAEWLKPIGTPVGAIDLRASCAGFTLGGLQTTLDSEVLHVSGAPIPGLYAAGRCTAGVAAWGYASGISLGDGSFYGRRAGRAAAKG